MNVDIAASIAILALAGMIVNFVRLCILEWKIDKISDILKDTSNILTYHNSRILELENIDHARGITDDTRGKV